MLLVGLVLAGCGLLDSPATTLLPRSDFGWTSHRIFMHLRFDHAWYSYVFIGPLIIAVGLAVALLWLFHHIGTTGLPPAGAG